MNETENNRASGDVGPLRDEHWTAARLAVSRRTLQGWRLRGLGPRFVKVGRAVRYDALEVERYIAGRTVVSTVERCDIA
jgi:predicted DNA-binding transcriptional regulator AlpA